MASQKGDRSMQVRVGEHIHRFFKTKTPYIVLVLLLAIGVTFSGAGNARKYESSTSKETLYDVSSGDTDMNDAIEKSRATISTFITSMNAPKANQREFTVKYPFPADPGSLVEVEHMWVDTLKRVDGDTYTGILRNDPEHVKSLTYGHTVTIDITKCSDWKYIEDGYLVGGRTLIYLLKQLSPEERTTLLESSGFKVKEFE